MSPPGSPATPAIPEDSAASGARLPFLDWVRIGAFVVLVFYHVGMFYVTWDWHIKSPHASTWPEPWMRLSSPWRMDLLFLVSGAATSCMLLRGGPTGALLVSRLRRLMLPLLLGVLVLVPPQSWLEVVHKLGYAGSYLDFMGLYLRAHDGFCFRPQQCLILPTWNHLWFLPYLFAYTGLLWLALRWRRSLLAHAAARLPALLSAWRLLWWPILFLLLTRWVLRDRFPPSHALLGDWFAHSQHLPMFLLGAVLVRAAGMWMQMAMIRWQALCLALAAWALLVTGSAPSEGGAVLRDLLVSVQQWCAIVAVLGFARLHLNHDSPTLRYLTDAVFPLYLLHQTVIVVSGHLLGPWQLAPVVEAAVLVMASLAVGFLAHALARRVAWLRPWFGVRGTGT